MRTCVLNATVTTYDEDMTQRSVSPAGLDAVDAGGGLTTTVLALPTCQQKTRIGSVNSASS